MAENAKRTKKNKNNQTDTRAQGALQSLLPLRAEAGGGGLRGAVPGLLCPLHGPWLPPRAARGDNQQEAQGSPASFHVSRSFSQSFRTQGLARPPVEGAGEEAASCAHFSLLFQTCLRFLPTTMVKCAFLRSFYKEREKERESMVASSSGG